MKLKKTISALTTLTLFPVLLLADSSSRARNRQNLFDPIFAYDDIDAHTVSAGSTSTYNNNKQDSQNYPSQFLSGDDDGPTFGRPDKTRREEKVPELDRKREQSVSTRPALVRPTFSRIEPASVSVERAKNKREPEQHWSALENYYQKLRQSMNSQLDPIGGQQGSYQHLPTYQVLQQEVDEPIGAYKPINSFAPYLIPGSINAPVNSNQGQQANKNQAFLLPLINSGTNQKQDSDFGFSIHHHSAPGISRNTGIGSGSILLNGDSVGSSLNTQQQDRNQWPASVQTKPTLAKIEDGKVKYLEWRKLPELLLIQQQQQRVKHQQETFGSWYDHQRSRELLQEEAFCGPRNYVNFHLVPALADQNQQQKLSSQTSQQRQYNPIQLSRIQLQIESSSGDSSAQQLDIPVALSNGEYPSHIGIYNGSVDDANFLCSATWVHESFALTLASCVKSVEPKKLITRVGEWNLNKNETTTKPMMTRQVDQVHLFPKYPNDSMEHNLALVKFSKPIEYLEVPYICPACQMQSRTSIKTSSCWAPVRSTTSKEYFDADGEGETKEKKVVNMVELPVRLIANDDNECYRQTKVEFFNFQHPNYICSADYRRAEWRNKLNQTDYFGSGIYCNEGGNLSLVSILHPIQANSSSAYGYLDLSYYRPWMRNIISGRNF